MAHQAFIETLLVGIHCPELEGKIPVCAANNCAQNGTTGMDARMPLTVDFQGFS